jgi:putative colanic acid biosysnthesis UDP-glucose lipid carrier transferase
MPPFSQLTFFIGDLIVLNASIAASYLIFGYSAFESELSNSIYLFIFSNLGWLFLALVSSPYDFSRTIGILRAFKSQVSFIFVHILMVASLIFFFKKNYSIAHVGIMYLLFIPLFFLWKTLMLFIFNLVSQRRYKARNILILGKGDQAREIRKYFLTHWKLNYRFLGYIDRVANQPLIEQIRLFCNNKIVHEIFCCLAGLSEQEIKVIVELGLNRLIKIKIITDPVSYNHTPLTLDEYDYVPELGKTRITLDERKNRIYKRIFDILFSSLVIILILSWLVPIIGVLIKIDSAGPVFFLQKRAGRDNKPFSCLKFRTMLLNPEADIKQATRGDSRITMIGKFLRKSSLDEIPQFFNVFMGTMSVIGPRPHPFKLNEQFLPRIERLMSRHYVKPGITGLAQCMGYRGETRSLSDMRNRIKLDRFYIENWSFYLDLKIMIQTIVSLLRANERAY